ncbi:MAG: hypothetical protein IJU87_02980 [Lachnospiraceae bacterium]|nr:hypothetical protein [Lachnospiraceae bacterium]
MSKERINKNAALLAAVIFFASTTGTACADGRLPSAAAVRADTGVVTEDTEENVADDGSGEIKDTDAYELMESSADGEHVITADGEDASYSELKIQKTGDSEGDEADFYGENSAVFATNGATLNLSDISVNTSGTHANAVFSYGEGTTVNISDSVILTDGNCSGGIMTTGGGTMNAENLTVHTTGNSSAAIRSDRGGGTVNVTGGSYSADGSGSPAVYSTADITVNDAELNSTTSEGIVVEGKNSVTLNNVTLTADNNKHNSDKSDNFKAVMIYQSMSGDADQGKAEFSMNGGSLTNMSGDVFFVNNTVADISLNNADISNRGGGAFLRAAAAGWGNEGENGGKVNLYADTQEINGDIVVDDISALNLYLSNGSEFTGTVNTGGEAGEVYVELKDGSKWTLTADSFITSLTCDMDAIDLNGHKLYIDGDEYKEDSEYSGEAIEIKSGSGVSRNGMPGQGNPPEGKGNPPEGGSISGNGLRGKGNPPQGNPPDGNGNPPQGNPLQGKPGEGKGNPPGGERGKGASS